MCGGGCSPSPTPATTGGNDSSQSRYIPSLYAEDLIPDLWVTTMNIEVLVDSSGTVPLDDGRRESHDLVEWPFLAHSLDGGRVEAPHSVIFVRSHVLGRLALQLLVKRMPAHALCSLVGVNCSLMREGTVVKGLEMEIFF